MITNTGKGILAKYIIGQAPEYASYIAFGCGPKPLSSISYNVTSYAVSAGTATLATQQNNDFKIGDYVTVKDINTNFNGTHLITAVTTNSFSFTSTAPNSSSVSLSPVGSAFHNFLYKESLDFEMFRQPITSRGYVVENGVAKIVLTAELPTDERYEITEIGVYSAGSNSMASLTDSRNILTFSGSENWKYLSSLSATGTSIPEITTAIDQGSNDNSITVTDPIFRTNADNTGFDNDQRKARYERSRFLNTTLLLKGDTTTFSSWTPDSNAKHISLDAFNVELSRNAPTDELRLAFSVVNTGGLGTDGGPDSVKILVRFVTSQSDVYSEMQVEVVDGTEVGQNDFTSNRYVVVGKKLSGLYTTSGFSWSRVIGIKVFAEAVVSATGANPGDYFIALDALRLENVSSNNPLYGLTGYSVITNAEPGHQPVIKKPLTSNYVEFRFSMDVS